MPNPHVDVLIVTVTTVESQAVLEVFREAAGHEAQPVPIVDRVYFDLGEVNGARLFLAISEMGAGGLGAAQQAVDKGIRALARSVIMGGIAFGVNETTQSIGDVLVTEQLHLYELQRVGTEAGGVNIILRGDKPHASPWLLNRLKMAGLLWPEATLRFGVVLTGEKLVDNLDFREQLRGFEPEAVGGEMEGAGLYTACQDRKVDWILVKAICDWADGHKKGDREIRQQIAARNAARFVLHAISFTPFHPPEVRPLPPRRPDPTPAASGVFQPSDPARPGSNRPSAPAPYAAPSQTSTPSSSSTTWSPSPSANATGCTSS